VSIAYDRLNTGYYNSGLKSVANPGGLSGTGALRVNHPALLADFCTVAAEAAASALAAHDDGAAQVALAHDQVVLAQQARADAQAFAQTAVNAPGASATSATNTVTIPDPATLPVDITLQTQAGKAFIEGMNVVAAEEGAGWHQIAGPIKSYDSVTGALVIHAHFAAGTTMPAAWKISLSAPTDATLTGRVSALEADARKRRNRHLLLNKDFA
jgi:hypothetical protein